MKNILTIILLITFLGSCRNDSILTSIEPPITTTLPSAIERLEFTYIQTPLPNALSTIYFVDEAIGYVAGYKGYVAGYKGDMFKTTDGGKSWTKLTINISSPINAIYFLNPNEGFILSNDIFQTKDGGQTWKTLSIHTSEPVAFQSICFPTDSIGYAVGSGTILSTKNRGITWKETKIDNLGGMMMDVKFINEKQGLIACGIGKLLKTTDGGINWKISSPFLAMGAFSLALVNENAIFCAGNSTISKSADFGSTWSDLPKSPYRLLKLIFTSENIGYAFGIGQYSGGDWGHSYGAIYYTTDGGSTWKGNDNLTKIGSINSANFPTEKVGFAISGNTVIKIRRL